eukprot:6024609-Alexandrium_andersonii.AAC.1
MLALKLKVACPYADGAQTDALPTAEVAKRPAINQLDRSGWGEVLAGEANVRVVGVGLVGV